MNIADPKYLEHLRDLPTGYLLDLMADNEEIDRDSIAWVLRERGLSYEEIVRKLERRRHSRWPRPYILWGTARYLTLLNAITVGYVNITGLSQLLAGDHAFREAFLFLAVGCMTFGFIIGYKLTTHVYQGGKAMLHCGFPVPVGFVDLETGKERLKGKTTMVVGMATNALVGISLTLFPLIFIYIMMD